MRNETLKNITAKADELANLYWKTKDNKYKVLWYQQLKKFSTSLQQLQEQKART
jgi:tRNA A22 N-methylase